MTKFVDAIVENGMLRPLQQLPFAEQQRVRVRVETIASANVSEWLATVEKHQRSVIQRVGTLPDTTEDISNDRNRDA